MTTLDRNLLNTLLRWLPIALFVVVAIYYRSIIIQSIIGLSSISLITLLIVSTLYSITWIIKGWKWKLILATDMISSLRLAIIILLGNFTSLFVPAKSGDLIRIQVADTIELSRTEIIASTLMDRVWDLIGILTGILLILLIYQPFSVVSSEFYLIGLITFIIGILFIYIVLPKYGPSIITNLPTRIQPVVSRFQEGLLLTKLKNIPVIFLTSTIVWLVEGFLLHIILLQFALSITWWMTVLAVLIANITKVLPLTPGGFVIYELTVGYILAQLSGFDLDMMVEFGILDSLLKNGYTIVLGLLSYYYWFIHHQNAD